ncbi:MAG: ABC transporter substrate-binding protein [Mesorhizobium sp.]
MSIDQFRRHFSRRKVLQGAAAAGVGLSAAGIVAGTPRYAIAGNPTKLRLSWTEFAACHSPVAFALANGIYAKHGLDVELFYQGASGQTLIQSIATNKTDAGAGLLYDWIKPLEQGLDVKLFVGSHGGCTRLLASKKSGVTKLEELKGKTIVSYDVASPPKHSFQVALAKAGLDPERDVNWTNVPFDLVGETVNRGAADALAHLDPWAFSHKKKFDLVEVANTQTGFFDGAVCCVLGVNTAYLEANKDAVRRLAEANIEIHEYAATHPEEVAQWFVKNLNPGFPVEDIHEQVASWVLHNHPVGKELREQVKWAADDLALIKVLDPGTDPTELAGRVTVDILA